MTLQFSNSALQADREDTFLQNWELRVRLGNNPFAVFDRIGDDEYWKNSLSQSNKKSWIYQKQGNFPNAFDFDNDGIADDSEEPNLDSVYENTETDRFRMDSDGDGFSDYSENFVFKTETRNCDSDFDMLSDTEEILIYHTDPNNSDSDNDGLYDGFEIKYNMDPLALDSNNNSVNDADEDLDNDGRNNLIEAQQNTDPLVVDTLDDGISCMLSRRGITIQDYRRNILTGNGNSAKRKASSGIISLASSYTFTVTNSISGEIRVNVYDVGPVDDAFEIKLIGPGKVVSYIDYSDRGKSLIADSVVNGSTQIELTSDGVSTTDGTPYADVHADAKPINAGSYDYITDLLFYDSSDTSWRPFSYFRVGGQFNYPYGSRLSLQVKLKNSSATSSSNFDWINATPYGTYTAYHDAYTVGVNNISVGFNPPPVAHRTYAYLQLNVFATPPAHKHLDIASWNIDYAVITNSNTEACAYSKYSWKDEDGVSNNNSSNGVIYEKLDTLDAPSGSLAAYVPANPDGHYYIMESSKTGELTDRNAIDGAISTAEAYCNTYGFYISGKYNRKQFFAWDCSYHDIKKQKFTGSDYTIIREVIYDPVLNKWKLHFKKHSSQDVDFILN